MAAELRHVVWLNRADDGLAFLLHEIAPRARVLGIAEIGATHCMMWQQARSTAAPLTLLPDAARWIEDGGVPERLDAALRLTLDAAASLRVLAAGDIVRADRWRRIEAAVRPDILCLAPQAIPLLPQPWLPGVLRRVDLDGSLADLLPRPPRLFAQPAALALLQDRLLRLEALAHARTSQEAASYPVADVLALQGVQLPEGGVGWTGPHRRSVLLLPGHGGGDLRLAIDLAASRLPLDRDHLRFWIDGREATASFGRSTITLLARGVALALCCRLEIAHAELPRGSEGEAPAGIAIRSISVARA